MLSLRRCGLILCAVLALMLLISPTAAGAFAETGLQVPGDLTGLEQFSARLIDQTDGFKGLDFKTLMNASREGGLLGGAASAFVNDIAGVLFSEVKGSMGLLLQLLATALLCSLLQNLQTGFGSSMLEQVAHYACLLIMALTIVKSLVLVVAAGREAIDGMIELTTLMMPPLIGIVAMSGGLVSAATLDPVILVAINLAGDVIRDLILPMTILVAVLGIVDSLSVQMRITSLVELIRQVNLWGIGFIMTVFIGVVTVRSSASTTMDQVALKSVKFAVDNFIPIVGKCFSDAVATVAGYSMILKDAISIAGLILMVIVCIIPLVKIILLALIFRLVGAIVEPVADRQVVDCLESVGGAMGILFASVLSVGVMFFIIITIIASTGRMIMLVR